MIKHLLVISIESGRLAAAAQLSVARELGSAQNKSRKASALRLKPISHATPGRALT